MITRLNPDTLHTNPAYSQAAIVSPDAALVFVGGQNGVTIDGSLASRDITGQTQQAMRNVIAALEAAGATLNDVVKFVIYLVQDQSLQEAFAASLPFYEGVKPATVSVLIVAGLANPDYLIEIECVAAIKPKAH
jgi:enamine deaminase RidA (YjgF/YER057c/UK114 family)